MAFKKGESGNPGGRPKELRGIQELARAHAEAAIAVLAQIATAGKSESARSQAAVALLDRGYGKPAQTVHSNVTRVDPNKLTDAELAAIAAGSGEDDTDPPEDQGKPD